MRTKSRRHGTSKPKPPSPTRPTPPRPTPPPARPEDLQVRGAYRDIIEELNEGYYEVDLEGRFLFLNPAMTRLVKMPREALMGLSFTEYFDAETTKAARAVFQNVFKTGETARIQSQPIRFKDRILYWVDFTVSLLRDEAGRVIGFRGLVHDVTMSKLAELAARRTNLRLSGLVQAIPDIVTIKSDERRYQIVNRAFEGAFGVAADDAVGKLDEDILPPDAAAACRRSDEAVLQARRTLRFEERIAGPRGETYYETIKAPLTDENGRPTGLISVCRDITDRKKKERELQDSLKEKELLIREVHHRVKNNLQVVASLLNLETRRLKHPADVELFKECQRRIQSMSIIHEKLYQSESLSRVDFGAYLKSLGENLFASFLGDRGRVVLKTDMDPVFLDIHTAIPCGLIVNELVTNALKHAFPGGRRGSIAIGLKAARGGEVRLTVRDDGVGLPIGRDVPAGGTMGMKIIDLLARQLKGRTEIKRKAGTEFRITFRTGRGGPKEAPPPRTSGGAGAKFPRRLKTK